MTTTHGLAVGVALVALACTAAPAARAQGNSTVQSRVFEHEHETPAARKDAREAAKNGQPDTDVGKPGGAYPVPDSASSSGTPAKGR